MKTNELSLSSMPDVCFQGWFGIIYFLIRDNLFYPFFSFPFVFIILVVVFLNWIVDLINQLFRLFSCIYKYCIFVNMSTLSKLLNR